MVLFGLDALSFDSPHQFWNKVVYLKSVVAGYNSWKMIMLIAFWHMQWYVCNITCAELAKRQCYLEKHPVLLLLRRW